jgi:molybdopterin molybdotransferase
MKQTTTQPASCQDDLDPAEPDPRAALLRILEAIRPVSGEERLELRGALGRIVAQTVYAATPLPAFTHAAMDGFACRIGGVAPGLGLCLHWVGHAYPGHPWGETLAPGTCVRISTGAMLPEGADCVVMLEHVQVEGGVVTLGRLPRVGENVRHQGSELPRGAHVIERGERLGAAHLGLLATLGMPFVTVLRRPRVAIFSTGDELRPLGAALAPGEIHDSNRYSLLGLLAGLPVEVFDLGIVEDRPEAIERTLASAATGADLVVSTGGVSAGDVDHVQRSLKRLGRVHLWKVAIKPGRPLLFGALGDTPVFGLPGNPVSVMVTWTQFVRPALDRLAGGHPRSPLRFYATLPVPVDKRRGREEFQRGILQRVSGAWQVRPTGDQGSGMLTSMARANCFIVLPREATHLPPGSTVEVEPFDSLLM